MWTFGKKLALGFSVSLVLLIAIGAVCYRALGVLTKTGYWVAHTHVVIEHVGGVLSILKDAETGQRGYVITGDEAFLAPYNAAVGEITEELKVLRDAISDDPNLMRHLDEAAPLVASKLAELARIVELRKAGGFEAAMKGIQGGQGKRSMDAVRRILAQMEREARTLLEQRAAEADGAAAGARWTILLGTLFCLLLTAGVGFLLNRTLAGQIGSAVRHVQSSSAELQAAANQQLTVTKEQATAMSEIATTLSELLATSRQIAESAQRVARVSTETASAARKGDDTVQRTQESVLTIRRQVDLIVAHMIDLGTKSQQIGGILEIINELAEQTNILAINATIEAAGAGELGRRFAVVADEIRKLADRVGGSTKEIRQLVDDIRSAVNTTVMATEGGSKAVDAGTREFGEVATSFKVIGGLVTTTSEAAREIELSTKQQSFAVEQVNLAVASVSQATKESEASSSQTLLTSSELTSLSRDLSRLIQPRASA